jgi:hypothetical protein
MPRAAVRAFVNAKRVRTHPETTTDPRQLALFGGPK